MFISLIRVHVCGLDLYQRGQRVLKACVRSPIKDFSVLCSAKTDPVIPLFPYSCQCHTEFRSTLSPLYSCLYVYACVRLSLQWQVWGLAEGLLKANQDSWLNAQINTHIVQRVTRQQGGSRIGCYHLVRASVCMCVWRRETELWI